MKRGDRVLVPGLDGDAARGTVIATLVLVQTDHCCAWLGDPAELARDPYGTIGPYRCPTCGLRSEGDPADPYLDARACSCTHDEAAWRAA